VIGVGGAQFCRNQKARVGKERAQASQKVEIAMEGGSSWRRGISRKTTTNLIKRRLKLPEEKREVRIYPKTSGKGSVD